MCVSYEEYRVAVGLPDSECVVLGRSVCVCVIRGVPSSCRPAGEIECVVLCRPVCVCVSYEDRRVAVDLLQRVSVVLGMSVCVCVCVCVVRLMPVAVGLPERVSVWCWAGPSVCVCVSYEECRVVVGLLEKLSAWCCAGPSVCVCHTRNAE